MASPLIERNTKNAQKPKTACMIKLFAAKIKSLVQDVLSNVFLMWLSLE